MERDGENLIPVRALNALERALTAPAGGGPYDELLRGMGALADLREAFGKSMSAASPPQQPSPRSAAFDAVQRRAEEHATAARRAAAERSREAMLRELADTTRQAMTLAAKTRALHHGSASYQRRRVSEIMAKAMTLNGQGKLTSVQVAALEAAAARTLARIGT